MADAAYYFKRLSIFLDWQELEQLLRDGHIFVQLKYGGTYVMGAYLRLEVSAQAAHALKLAIQVDEEMRKRYNQSRSKRKSKKS